MSATETLLIVSAALLGAVLLGFWIWMLVDCLRDRRAADVDKVLWTMVIVFMKPLGALVYYFLRYRPGRRAALGRSAS